MIKEKKEQNKWKLITVILLVFIILIFVIPFPYNNIEEYTGLGTHESCTTRIYKADIYSRNGEEIGIKWRNGLGVIKDKLIYKGKYEYRIYNYEDEPGMFSIQFDLYCFDDKGDGKLILTDTEDYTVGKNSYIDRFYRVDKMINRVKNEYDSECLGVLAEFKTPEIENCEIKYKEETKYRIVKKYDSLLKQWVKQKV